MPPFVSGLNYRIQLPRTFSSGQARRDSIVTIGIRGIETKTEILQAVNLCAQAALRWDSLKVAAAAVEMQRTATDKLILPVVLRLGLTDGVQTEIVEGKLKEGDKVILSVEVSGNRSASPAATRAPGFGGPMGGRGGMR